MPPFLIYLLSINALGFAVAALDKLFAQKHTERVPERTLFLLAAVGGSVGVYAAMLLFRHKTRRAAFMFGLPGILLIQLVLLYVVSL